MEYEMVTCPKCGRGQSKRDFFGREVCYKCTYEVKTEADYDNGIKRKEKRCKICGFKILIEKRFYCSQVCADEGLAKKKAEYWANKLKDPKESWKENGFNFWKDKQGTKVRKEIDSDG